MKNPVLQRYVLLMLVVYAGWIALYYLTAWVGAERGPAFEVALAIDAAIPLVPEVMPVYLLAYVVIPGLLMISREPRFLNQAYGVIIVANLIAFFIFAIFPVLGPPRDIVALQSSNDTNALITMIHAVDSRYNAFPSLHVTNPWLVALLCARERGSSLLTVVFVIVAVSITAATLLVKQHYFLDAVGGIALALMCFALLVVVTGRSGAPASA